MDRLDMSDGQNNGRAPLPVKDGSPPLNSIRVPLRKARRYGKSERWLTFRLNQDDPSHTTTKAHEVANTEPVHMQGPPHGQGAHCTVVGQPGETGNEELTP